MTHKSLNRLLRKLADLPTPERLIELRKLTDAERREFR